MTRRGVDVFDQIGAVIGLSKNHVIVVVAPRGSSLPLVRRRLISELRYRDVMVSILLTDPTSDLTQDVRVAAATNVDAIVASGLETASESDAREYLRRTSFRRSTLSQLGCPVVLVLSEATWAWLALELPDLARWLDGPFIAPATEARSVLQRSRPFLGHPIPASEHVELDHLRGLRSPLSEFLVDAEHRLVVLGGPLGVGLTHLAARFQQQRASRGEQTVWPPGVAWINGQKRVDPLPLEAETPARSPVPAYPNIREWLESAEPDALLIVPRLWLPDEGIRWLAERRGGLVLGTAQQGLSRSLGRARTAYVPPIYLDGEDSQAEQGRQALIDVMVARIDAAGLDQAAVVTPGALEFIARLSGGVPGIAIELLSNCHEIAGATRIDEDAVRPRALDLASRIQRVSGPARFDTHCRQLLYTPSGPKEVEHPLVRLLGSD